MRLKQIAVFTSTRADYGLLKPLMKGIEKEKGLNLQLIVSGSHLSPEFGNTLTAIHEDGFKVNEKVEMLVSSDSSVGITKSLGLGIIGYTDALARLKPDYLIVLGDRYEALGIAQVAFLSKIKLVHLHGGEITSGALDDSIRHAITKLSTIHITASEEYRSRVIQLGEDPETVFNYGAIGIDNIKKMKFLSKSELFKKLQLAKCDKYFVFTFHPTTAENENIELTLKSLFSVLNIYPEYKIIWTYPGVDEGSREIINFAKEKNFSNPDRIRLIKSMGSDVYLSALKYADLVIGNSSSGIIEAPSIGLPTLNIGSRQKGRLAAESVFTTGVSRLEIEKGIKFVLEMRTKKDLNNLYNPYGNGNTSTQIIKLLKKSNFSHKKYFYDLKI